MKILAIDASGQVASVSLLADETMIAEYTIDYKKTHSQTLLPMIDEIMKMTETETEDIDFIAVSSGPGSFTGLRIGAATAKGLALSLKKKIIAVPTLLMLAYNFLGSEYQICPMMDARRNQVYTGLYKSKGNSIEIVNQETACSIDDMIENVNLTGMSTVFLGDGIKVYQEQLKEKVTVPYLLAQPHMAKQRAGSLATAAMHYYIEGNVLEPGEFAPDYLRMSQAERERKEKQDADQANG